MTYKRRKRYRKKSMSKRTIATKDYVKRKLSSTKEIKWYGLQDSQTYDYNGEVICLTAVPQQSASDNATDTLRIGDTIRIKFLEIRGTITVAEQETLNANIMRIVVFQWYDIDSNTEPVPLSVLTNIGSYGIISSFQHDNRNSYGILHDKSYLVNELYKNYIAIKIKVPLKYAKKNIYFQAGGLYGKNNIYMLVLADSALTNHPRLTYQTKFLFTDS